MVQAMASTDFSNEDARRILNFLGYDASHMRLARRPGALKLLEPLLLGVNSYIDQNCNVCHKVAGAGGSGGPALYNVGRTLTPEKVTQKMMGMRSGSVSSMPPLPPTTTDEQIQSLVAYLSSLKGNQ